MQKKDLHNISIDDRLICESSKMEVQVKLHFSNLFSKEEFIQHEVGIDAFQGNPIGGS